jgi:hypothetical protein
MTRLFSLFLLCLAMIAIPAQGAAAAVMMVCSAAQPVQARQALPADSPAMESMMLRHMVVKSQAEAALGSPASAHCHHAPDAAQEAPGTGDAHAQPAHQDHMDHMDHMDHHASHGAGGACSACAACAAGAILPTILSELALASHGHAAPQAMLATYAGILPAPSYRPPAAHC